MTPRQWDQIADAFDRIADAGHRRPVSRLDERAEAALLRMRCRMRKRRGNRTVSAAAIVSVKRVRARGWAEYCRRMALICAVRIDFARPHPTTTGPVANDRLPSDRELERNDRQRLKAERGRHLRAYISEGIE